MWVPGVQQGNGTRLYLCCVPQKCSSHLSPATLWRYDNTTDYIPEAVTYSFLNRSLYLPLPLHPAHSCQKEQWWWRRGGGWGVCAKGHLKKKKKTKNYDTTLQYPLFSYRYVPFWSLCILHMVPMYFTEVICRMICGPFVFFFFFLLQLTLCHKYLLFIVVIGNFSVT